MDTRNKSSAFFVKHSIWRVMLLMVMRECCVSLLVKNTPLVPRFWQKVLSVCVYARLLLSHFIGKVAPPSVDVTSARDGSRLKPSSEADSSLVVDGSMNAQEEKMCGSCFVSLTSWKFYRLSRKDNFITNGRWRQCQNSFELFFWKHRKQSTDSCKTWLI